MGNGLPMTNEPESTKEVVPAEDLSAEVEELMRFAAERGRVARAAATTAHQGRAPVFTTRTDKADITPYLREELQQALEDEVLPAVSAGTERVIRDWELQREVAKKALVGLRLSTLRRLAQEHVLDKRGRSEDVAERLARAYKFDETAIARLVLDNEEEPEPERGHTDRLFPLAATLDLDAVHQKLERVTDRYIRVGVARWFVFEDLQRSERSLLLTGKLRSYKAFVSSETATPHLGATPSESDVRLRVYDGHRLVRIRGNTTATSRAGMRALEIVTGVSALGYLPVGRAAAKGRLASIDERTALMLDVVYNRLAGAGVRNPNLTVARFQMSEGGTRARGEESDRPAVRAVRFEGDHLLDSAAACHLIAREGRALTDLSLLVSLNATNSGDEARFPVRIALDRDHGIVVTGFGRERPEASAELHRSLVGVLEDAVNRGIKDPETLETLIARIYERASSDGPVGQADILRDHRLSPDTRSAT